MWELGPDPRGGVLGPKLGLRIGGRTHISVLILVFSLTVAVSLFSLRICQNS